VKLLRHFLTYLFLVLTGALGFYMFVESREFVKKVLQLLGARFETFNAIDKFVVIVMGLVVLGIVIFCEDRYRKKAEKGVRELVKDFIKVSAVLLLVIVTFQTPILVDLGRKIGWIKILVPPFRFVLLYFVELAVAVLLFLLSHQLKNNHLRT